MLVLQILLLGIFLLVIPVIVGSLFLGVDKCMQKLPFLWISGQMLLWAGFFVITVPLVLTEGRFGQVVGLFLGYIAVLASAAVVRYLLRKKKGSILSLAKEKSDAKGIGYYLIWALFWGLLLFQIVQAFCLSYADGDDAYYVAVATITEEADTMYRKLAYTGGTTQLDARYGLAPFPLWISFLARVSGIKTVSVALVVVPPVLISMTYGIYYLLGSKLFAHKKERVAVFLIFMELLVLFGDYSFYTAERFMIARSRQGKAALGSIMIPMLFLLLLLLLEKVQENQKVSFVYWVLLLSTLVATCLCSTLGAMLGSMLIGIAGLCAAICYRRWRLLVPLAACCIPCVIVALLYVML